MTVTVQDEQRPAAARDTMDVAVVSPAAVVRAGFEGMLAALPGLSVRYCVDSVTLLPPPPLSPALAVIDVYGLGRSRLNDRYWSMLPAGTRAILVCRLSELPSLPDAVRAGVRALVTRDSELHELAAAVQAAGRDDLYLSAELVGALSAPTVDGRADRQVRLSDREIQTLRLVADGLTHVQISRHLGLTEATVNTYVKRIRTKLHAANKAELTLRAIALGYVTPR